MARTTLKIKQPIRGGGGRRGEVILSFSFTLGASGALSAAAGFWPITTTAGTFGVIKTSAKTGRYTFVTDRKYRSLRPVGAPAIQGPADTAFGNTSANAAQFRNVTTSGFDVQLMLASSGADTDGASGYVVSGMVVVEEFGGKT